MARPAARQKARSSLSSPEKTHLEASAKSDCNSTSAATLEALRRKVWPSAVEKESSPAAIASSNRSVKSAGGVKPSVAVSLKLFLMPLPDATTVAAVMR
jgi:hypothetical protein